MARKSEIRQFYLFEALGKIVVTLFGPIWYRLHMSINYSRVVSYVVALAIVTSSYVLAQPANCDLIVRQGWFRKTSSSTDLRIKNSAVYFLFTHIFQNSQEAQAAGLGLDFEIDGIPIMVKGDYKSESHKTWISKHQEYSKLNSENLSSYRELTESVDPSAVRAYNACLDKAWDISTKFGIVGWPTNEDRETITFNVRWVPAPKTSPLKVIPKNPCILSNAIRLPKGLAEEQELSNLNDEAVKTARAIAEASGRDTRIEYKIPQKFREINLLAFDDAAATVVVKRLDYDVPASLTCASSHGPIQVASRPTVASLDYTVRIGGERTVIDPISQAFVGDFIDEDPNIDTDISREYCLSIVGAKLTSYDGPSVHSANCGSSVGSHKKVDGKECVLVPARLKGCRRDIVGASKGRGWLDYRITLNGTKESSQTLPVIIREGSAEMAVFIAYPPEALGASKAIKLTYEATLRVRAGSAEKAVTLTDANSEQVVPGVGRIVARPTPSGGVDVSIRSLSDIVVLPSVKRMQSALTMRESFLKEKSKENLINPIRELKFTDFSKEKGMK